MNGEKMTPTEETTAALIVKLQTELETSKAECHQWRKDIDAERTISAQLGQQVKELFAATSKAQDERDEQRARAEKTEEIAEVHAARCVGFERELAQERLKSQALLNFKNIWLDRCTKARQERDEAREQLAKLEWGGIKRVNAGSSLLRACPICNGLQPDEDVIRSFKGTQIGHKPECWFAKGKAAPIEKSPSLQQRTTKQTVYDHWLDAAVYTLMGVDWPGGTSITVKTDRPLKPGASFVYEPARGIWRLVDKEPARCSLCWRPDVTGKAHPYARCKERDDREKELARSEPKFKVGQKVCVHGADIQWGITAAEWNGTEWRYEGPNGWWWAECKIVPAPKFAVGEWVTRKYRSALPGVEIERREWRSGITHPAGGWLYSWGSSGGCDWEDDLTAQTPQHKHDCAGCVFLGRLGEADLYYCQGPCDGQMAATVAVLFPGRARSITRREALFATKDHIEARRRAVARGLVKA